MNGRNLLLPTILLLLIGTAIGLWFSSEDPIKPTLSSRIPEILIFSTNAEYPPFAFRNEDNDFIGFDIDLAHEIAHRLNKHLHIKDIPFAGLVAATQIGTTHIAGGGLAPDAEREEKILFTRPYLTDQLIIVTNKEDAPISSISELANKIVAVNTDHLTEKLMTGQPGVELLSVPKIADGFIALESGQADAFISSQIAVIPFLQEHGRSSYRIVPLEGAKENIALGVSKKYPELLPLIQRALSDMEYDGTLDKLKRKWGIVQ